MKKTDQLNQKRKIAMAVGKPTPKVTPPGAPFKKGGPIKPDCGCGKKGKK